MTANLFSTTLPRGLIAGFWAVVLSAAALSSAAWGVELSEEDVEVFNRGNKQFQDKKFAEAAKTLEPLRVKYRDFAEAPRLLAHAYFELGRLPEARQAAVDAVGLGRLTTDTLIRLAQIDRADDDRLALTNTVRLLTVIDPANLDWRLLYADLLADGEAYRESAVIYRELLARNPDDPKLHTRLGNVLLRQELDRDAAAELETAFRLGDDAPKLPRTLASVWARLGDERQALAWTERALSLEKDDPSLRLQRAGLLYQLGDWDPAAEAAQTLVQSPAPFPMQAELLLGKISMKRGQPDQAVEHWRKAASLGTADPQLLTFIGGHFYNAGDFPQAADYLRQVVDRGSTEEEHLRFLVISLARCQHAETRRYLRLYLEHHGLTDESRKLIALWSRS